MIIMTMCLRQNKLIRLLLDIHWSADTLINDGDTVTTDIMYTFILLVIKNIVGDIHFHHMFTIRQNKLKILLETQWYTHDDDILTNNIY